jgi:hypothetical protein
MAYRNFPRLRSDSGSRLLESFASTFANFGAQRSARNGREQYAQHDSGNYPRKEQRHVV